MRDASVISDPLALRAARTMLDLEPSAELAARSLPEMISLLYRDDVRQKHADKNRLGQEIANFRSNHPPPPPPPPPGAEVVKKLGYRSRILVDHLVQAARYATQLAGYVLESIFTYL